MKLLNRTIKLSVVLTLYLVLCPNITGQEQAFGLTEKLGEFLPGEINVLNEDSAEVNLRVLIDKPTLLVFVYYSCPALCPKMLDGIAELVNFSKSLPGIDYQIVVLSIDQNESTKLANSAKKIYTEKVKRPVNAYFWRFFTADSVAINVLTNAVGWEFRKAGNDFIHTTSSVLISPKGMVSEYFYGTYFNYMHFDMSLINARDEVLTPTRLKSLKYCYNFQPEKNRNVEAVTKIFGITIIILVLGLFLFLLKGAKRKE